MVVLSRGIGGDFMFDEQIRVNVREVRGDRVHLVVTASQYVLVESKEASVMSAREPFTPPFNSTPGNCDVIVDFGNGIRVTIDSGLSETAAEAARSNAARFFLGVQIVRKTRCWGRLPTGSQQAERV